MVSFLNCLSRASTVDVELSLNKCLHRYNWFSNETKCIIHAFLYSGLLSTVAQLVRAVTQVITFWTPIIGCYAYIRRFTNKESIELKLISAETLTFFNRAENCFELPLSDYKQNICRPNLFYKTKNSSK